MKHEIGKASSGGMKIVDEEDVTLKTMGKNKGMSKKGASSDGANRKEEKKKDIDISKVKFWACQKIGHYVAMCPE